MLKIDAQLLDELSHKAILSARLRINHNFHHGDSDPLQRMLNVMHPGTYIRPHLHHDPDKREVFICLRGSFVVVEYEHDGNIHDFVVLDPSSGNYACEIAPNRYHSMIALSPGSVAYELKDGPYDVATDKKFAPWAPEEGSPLCQDFIRHVLQLTGIA